MKALVLSLDGRHLVIQGPPGSGQDVDVGPADRRLLARGQARRRRLDEPQGDPQAARRGRGGAGSTVAGRQEGERRQPRVVLRGRADRERHRARPTARDAPLARRHGLALRARRPRPRRSTTCSSTRPARSRSPTRSRWARARGTSCSSATRSSSRRCSRARTPTAADASVLKHLLGDARDDPARPRPLPRAHLPAAPGRLRLHLGGVLRGAAAARPVHRDADDAARDGAALPRRSSTRAAGRSRAEEAAARRAREVERLLAAGVAAAEIMVVAPYNAQVNLLARARCPTACASARSTSSRGRRRDVVLYSMASSSGEDVPRGLEFLLSRNRLNVAISRAQCLAYLVCSPAAARGQLPHDRRRCGSRTRSAASSSSPPTRIGSWPAR